MPVDLPTLVAAALAGVLGGLHCAVMCGGIAASFPAAAPGRPLAVAWQANLGRISGYVIAGALAGGLGGGLLRVLRIEALVVGVRMAAGVALILVALRLLDRG
ncbi:MAG: sulfite exporter TauE/SafE family protein, partial [Cellulomonas iranensis]